MDFEGSLTTTTTTTSLDSTPAVVTAVTKTAFTTTVSGYTPSLDMSTIARDPSPITLSSETLSHLSSEFFTNRPVGSLQDDIEIAARELSPQNQTNFMVEIYDLLGDLTDATNAMFAWLSNFAERILDWKMLIYKPYNDFLKALDSSARVREMIKQHHSGQQRKTQATKKLGDLWQHYPELQEILSDSSRSEKWMR
jgi:hypothetical protein